MKKVKISWIRCSDIKIKILDCKNKSFDYSKLKPEERAKDLASRWAIIVFNDGRSDCAVIGWHRTRESARKHVSKLRKAIL